MRDVAPRTRPGALEHAQALGREVGVLVRGALVPGDAIITEGILQLSEGAAVTLLEGPDGTPAATATATP